MLFAKVPSGRAMVGRYGQGWFNSRVCVYEKNIFLLGEVRYLNGFSYLDKLVSNPRSGVMLGSTTKKKMSYDVV